MNIREYLDDGADILGLARAHEIEAAKVILKVVRLKRDKLRAVHESRRPEDINPQNAVAETAQISVLNWILELPEEARKTIKQAQEEENKR